ncbi:MAG: hypothetical protein HYV07_34160 [Deltaproteobacteria bacterium]|nr:hypothetical protein [Deltaproteobacteria bacterium]
MLSLGPAGAAAVGTLLRASDDRFVVCLDQARLIAKVYLEPRTFGRLIARLIGSRALRAARKLELARRAGVPAPEPYAVYESAMGSVLFMSLVPNARPLRDTFFSLDGGGRIRLLRAVAKLLRSLHDHRIYPSDFNDTNVLVTESGDPVLIDPEGLRRVLWVSTRRRVRNLERLLRAFLGSNRVPAFTRLRFVAEYTRAKGTRQLVARIARRFETKRAQYALRDP